MSGYLKYVVKNCMTAFDELCHVNKELVGGMTSESNLDVNHLGALNRMIQDYLIIRVAGLFDKDTRAISLFNATIDSKEIENIRREKIIDRLIMSRNKFVAHSDRNYISKGEFIIPTSEICNSNLGDIFSRLEQLLVLNITTP